MAGTLLGVGDSVKKNKASLVGARGLPAVQWERWTWDQAVMMPRASALCVGAEPLHGADSLGVLPGASIMYIETWGSKETPRGKRGDEGFQLRELCVEV